MVSAMAEQTVVVASRLTVRGPHQAKSGPLVVEPDPVTGGLQFFHVEHDSQ